jgi:hypothetical protein
MCDWIERSVSVTLDFLVRCRLIESLHILETQPHTRISCSLETITSITIIPVVGISNMFQMLPQIGRITVLVTRDKQYTDELLLYNNTDTLNLMRNNVLVVHVMGMIATLSTTQNYLVSFIIDTGNNQINRRKILNVCNDPSSKYVSMLKDEETCTDKANCIFYHRLQDPLETLGVEYLFSLYRTCTIHRTSVDRIICIIRQGSTVSLIQVFE